MVTPQIQWTDDDVRAFLARYGRAPARLEVTQLRSWWRNLVLRVEADDETFILRRYGLTRAAEVEWELELIGVLRAQGFPTIEPISMVGSGQALSSFLDAPAVLYRYIEGVAGREVAWDIAAPAAARAVGWLNSITNGLVLHARRNPGGPEPLPTLRRIEAAVGGDIERAPLLRAFLDGAASMTHAVFRRAAASHVRVGPVHRDGHEGNTIFRDGELVGLIDFDDAYEGPLLGDLAALISNWAVDASDRLDAPRVRVIIDAYEERSPLPRSERALVADFVVLHLLGDALERACTRADQGARGDEVLEANDQLLRYRRWRGDTDALDALRGVLAS